MVFPNQDGNTRINMNCLGGRVIKSTLEALGMEWHGLYACRRGFGTLMVDAGASLEETSQAMGNSPTVCYRHYYLPRESKRAASGIAKLNAALNGMTASNQVIGSPRLLQSGEGQ